MIKLRDWQQEASSKCLEWYSKKEDNRFIINAAPGTGKTICAISIADELIKQNLVERVVVIAPIPEAERIAPFVYSMLAIACPKYEVDGLVVSR